ncbi:DedA family protein [Martelella alba]|uniref:DedA family protein n=1 Tax=Martelella alba TaxID=2590451 RepID=UPI0015E847D7|nr:DedA family protein [Martelella alba]
MSITAELSTYIMSTIDSAGYWAVGILMALESACLPIPSEVVMPFAGYLASIGHMDLIIAATVGAVGCNIGSTLAYLAGYYGGRPFIERWGRYILINHAEIEKVVRFFDRYGAAAVFIARLLPIVRSFISLPAGISKMPQWKFQLYSFLGSWPWCFVLAFIGFRLGKAWQNSPWLREMMHSFHLAIAIMIAFSILLYLFHKFRKSQDDI